MEKSVLQRLEESHKRWVELAQATEAMLQDSTRAWGFADCLSDIIDWCKDEEWVRTKTDAD